MKIIHQPLYLVMKKALVIVLLFITVRAGAQTAASVDSVNFCSVKFKVPAGCEAKSEYELKCDNYAMVWLYMNDDMWKANLPEQFITQSLTQLNRPKKTAIPIYLLNQKVKGYKITFKSDSTIKCELVAYGIINSQPVFVQLVLNAEPNSNKDIPDLPLQIIKLDK